MFNVKCERIPCTLALQQHNIPHTTHLLPQTSEEAQPWVIPSVEPPAALKRQSHRQRLYRFHS